MKTMNIILVSLLVMSPLAHSYKKHRTIKRRRQTEKVKLCTPKTVGSLIKVGGAITLASIKLAIIIIAATTK